MTFSFLRNFPSPVKCEATNTHLQPITRHKLIHTILPPILLLPNTLPTLNAIAAAPLPTTPSEIYSSYPYIKPSDILPFLQSYSTRGDIPSILKAIETFAQAYPFFITNNQKATIIEQVLKSAPTPITNALELGTFMAYGSLRIQRNLAPGGRLVTIEANPEQADVARQVLEWAGVAPSRVEIVTGLASEVLSRSSDLGDSTSKPLSSSPSPFQFIFLDHCKQCYLPDLIKIEELGLIGPGSILAADNMVVPSYLSDYLDHVDYHTNNDNDIDIDTEQKKKKIYSYATRLVEADFEVTEKWRKDYNEDDDKRKKDALAISTCIEQDWM